MSVRTRVDVADDLNTWDWTMPEMLRMSREAALGWYEKLCREFRDDTTRLEAAYLGAEEGDFPDAQRTMAECVDASKPFPDDPEVLALAVTAQPDEMPQWVRALWAMYGPETTLDAMRRSLSVVWDGSGETSTAVAGARRKPVPLETDFLRGLLNTLPASERSALRRGMEPWFDVAGDDELRYWIQVFPDDGWVGRLGARSSDDRRAWALAATMVPSQHDAGSHLREHLPIETADVGRVVVNLLRNFGHGKTMKILDEVLQAQPDLVPALVEAFDDVVRSVAACRIALRDVEAGRAYLTQHPQHTFAAFDALDEPTERQRALVDELRALPGPSETAETVSYWPLDWEVEYEELVATGPGAFGAWEDVTIHVRIDPHLWPQIDEGDPVAALDLLQPHQRETLQFVVAQWTTIAMVAGTILQDNGADPLHVTIREDDEALVYGIAATSATDTEHGLGISMKALAVSNIGGMASVL